MKIPKLFHNCDSLVRFLKEKAKPYPLISKLYIPIIERHAKKHPSFSDFDDWLLILYFQYLWKSSKIPAYKKALEQKENHLVQIQTALGEQMFKKLQSDLSATALSETIDDIHNKLLDFYCELKALKYFLNSGYNVERVPKKNNKKTPDLLAKKSNKTIIVECKFIHETNPIRTFIRRYFRYLGHFPEFSSPNNLLPSRNHFSYEGKFETLKPTDLTELKAFIQDIIHENINKTLNVGAAKVCFQSKEEHITYFNTTKHLEQLFNTRVQKKGPGALKQIESHSDINGKKCLYVFIEFDEELNPPYKAIDLEKKQMAETFKKNHPFDLDIIIDPFPPFGLPIITVPYSADPDK